MKRLDPQHSVYLLIMYPWLLLQLCPVFVAALGTIVSDYNNILLCNSSINKANASGTVTFHSPLDWGNVGSPSYAVTVAQGNNVTQRTIWYDTAGRNYSNDLQIGFDACVSAVYGLPINTIELGQDDPGDCSTVLSQSCREAVTSEIANIATGLTYNGRSRNWQSHLQAFAQLYSDRQLHLRFSRTIQ